MKHLRFFAFALLLLAACKPISTNTELNTDNTPKLAHHAENVILLIGDGMGVTQISAALFSNDNRLNLEAFPVVGLHKSYAADDLITDSAAGATAFASGVKTYNAAIGVNKDTLPVPTILEEAKSRGYAVGLVATSSITHATPASFIAHVKSRNMMEDIALDFLKTDIDIFIGGGKKYFDRREKDERNLIAELKNKGYQINDYTQSELKQITPNPAKPFGYFSADAEPLPWSKGRDYLVPATNMALNFLEQRSKKGFFLMIEGSQIDWGGHANDSKYIIEETLDFDRAIGVVLEFAKRNGKTLVIVTADHETGGYAINQGSKMGDIVPGFTTDKHTAALIPVFAYGPGAELFSGLYENTAIYNKIRLALGFK